MIQENKLIDNIILEKASKIKISIPWIDKGDFLMEFLSRDDRVKLYNDLMNDKTITVPGGTAKVSISRFYEMIKDDNISRSDVENQIKKISDELKKDNEDVKKENLEGFVVEMIKNLSLKESNKDKTVLAYNNGKYGINNILKQKFEEALNRF